MNRVKRPAKTGERIYVIEGGACFKTGDIYTVREHIPEDDENYAHIITSNPTRFITDDCYEVIIEEE